MYMICYCVGKMNTPGNYKTHIYERRKKLREQLLNNSLYKDIKTFAKKAYKIGKPIVPKKDDTNIAKRFVYDYWCWRIEILKDNNMNSVSPGDSLSMVNEVETFIISADSIKKGWLIDDALFCQPDCWKYFLSDTAKTNKVYNRDLGRTFYELPEKTKKLVDIMISLNHIYLDLGVGKLRDPEYGILSKDEKGSNYSVKETKWVKDCPKLKM